MSIRRNNTGKPSSSFKNNEGRKPKDSFKKSSRPDSNSKFSGKDKPFKKPRFSDDANELAPPRFLPPRDGNQSFGRKGPDSRNGKPSGRGYGGDRNDSKFKSDGRKSYKPREEGSSDGYRKPSYPRNNEEGGSRPPFKKEKAVSVTVGTRNQAILETQMREMEEHPSRKGKTLREKVDLKEVALSKSQGIMVVFPIIKNAETKKILTRNLDLTEVIAHLSKREILMTKTRSQHHNLITDVMQMITVLKDHSNLSQMSKSHTDLNTILKLKLKNHILNAKKNCSEPPTVLMIFV